MSTIKDEWESYKNEVLPKDAPPIQIKECRMAFYAGVHSALMFHVNVATVQDSETALHLLETWHQESKAFVVSL